MSLLSSSWSPWLPQVRQGIVWECELDKGEKQDEEGRYLWQAAGENMGPAGFGAVALMATEMSLILWGCICVSSHPKPLEGSRIS